MIYLFFLSIDLPSLKELQKFNPEQISKIISADGIVIKELYLQKRDIVKIGEIPSHLRYALLAMEDRNFFDHSGISFRSIFRAAITNFFTFSTKQGASTITQQLARNMYNIIGFKKTINRKLKEAITAINIEQTYTKSEIMEMYFNSVYFGHGNYGVQSASKYYFGKNISEINLNEAAIIIGLLPAPARFSPKRHPERSKVRKNLVLRVMHQQGYITNKEYAIYKAKEIPKATLKNDGDYATYFTEFVRRELEKLDEELNINLYKDGLNIYTTLDTRIQSSISNSFNKIIIKNQESLNNNFLNDPDQLDKIVDKYGINMDTLKNILINKNIIPDSLKSQLLVQGSVVVLDPKTGGILGMIGGRQEAEYRDHFNRSVQAKRQPGSVFKPLIYLTALEKGCKTNDCNNCLNKRDGCLPIQKRLNQPLVFFIDDTIRWNPQNHDGSTGGWVRLREGLKRSLNLISVRIVQELINPIDIVNNAKKFGINTIIEPVDAIALGVSDVTLLDISSVYSTISNNGIYNKPFGINKIEDRHGRLIKKFNNRKHSREVKDESLIYLLRDMMKSVVDESGGTGHSLRWKYKYNGTLAGKTGTTNSKADAWFVGFTPQLTMGVWMGVDDPSISLGKRQYGSVAALPVFANSIKDIYKNKGEYKSSNLDIILDSEKDWYRPKNIKEYLICDNTNKIATSYCPKTFKELFISYNSDIDSCKKHTNVFSRWE